MIIHGAEASVQRTAFLGRDAIRKERVPKSYRHESLDERLRNERTRDEARIMTSARKAGVPVPILYDVDRTHACLVMEEIAGRALRDQLPEDDDDMATFRFHHLGAIIARLHEAGLTHGDLTTSNILVPEAIDAGSLVLIDFGLGQFSVEDEDRAVDIHLIEEALEATEPRVEALMEAFLDGYQWKGRAFVLRRFEAIKERGRYRGAS